jgi:acyl carrier protein phosphodiesterase
MNYLAHAWLSGSDPQWILGGYLGDHVRGQDWRDYPRPVAAGIMLHRRIDSHVDAHPAFKRARERLNPPFRRYAGILLDMYFDHQLASQWQAISDQPLADYARDQYRLLRKNRDLLPESLKRFADYLEANNLLFAYRQAPAVARSLAGIGRRLRRANPLHEGMTELLRNAEGLNKDFSELWPELSAWAGELRDQPQQLFA